MKYLSAVEVSWCRSFYHQQINTFPSALPMSMHLVSFGCLTVLAKNISTVSHRYEGSGQPCLIFAFGGNVNFVKGPVRSLIRLRCGFCLLVCLCGGFHLSYSIC